MNTMPDCRVCLSDNIAVVGGVNIELALLQAEFLFALCSRRTKFMNYYDLAAAMWGKDRAPDNWLEIFQVIAVHLRRKLQPHGLNIVNIGQRAYGLAQLAETLPHGHSDAETIRRKWRRWDFERLGELEHALAVEGLSHRRAAERVGVHPGSIGRTVARYLPHLMRESGAPTASDGPGHSNASETSP